MDLYLFLTDPATTAYASGLYLISLYILARTMIKARQLDRKRKIMRAIGRHVASDYIPRWSTPVTPRHKALTDAPERWLATWDTAPMKIVTQPIPVRTPITADLSEFVRMARRGEL